MTRKRYLIFILIPMLMGAAFQYGGVRYDITSISTSATPVVLTTSSLQVQRFTGSSAQTVTLPDATSFSKPGFRYTIINESTGAIDVNNDAGVLVRQVAAASQSAPTSATFYVASTSTNGGPWSVDSGLGSSGGSSAYEFVGAAHMEATANCAPTVTNGGTANFGTDADCPGITVDINPGSGTIQTTDADGPIFTVNSLPAGIYKVKIWFMTGSAAGVQFGYTLGDGTTDGMSVSERRDNAGTTGLNYVHTEGYFTYASSGNRTFQPRCGGDGVNACTIQAGVSTADVNFTIEKVAN